MGSQDIVGCNERHDNVFLTPLILHSTLKCAQKRGIYSAAGDVSCYCWICEPVNFRLFSTICCPERIMSQRPHCSELCVQQCCLSLSLVLHISHSPSVPPVQTAVSLLPISFFFSFPLVLKSISPYDALPNWENISAWKPVHVNGQEFHLGSTWVISWFIKQLMVTDSIFRFFFGVIWRLVLLCRVQYGKRGASCFSAN